MWEILSPLRTGQLSHSPRGKHRRKSNGAPPRSSATGSPSDANADLSFRRSGERGKGGIWTSRPALQVFSLVSVSPPTVTRCAGWRLQSYLIVPGLACQICSDQHRMCSSQLCGRLHVPCSPQHSQERVPATELSRPQLEVCFQGGTFLYFLCLSSSKTSTRILAKGSSHCSGEEQETGCHKP